MGPNSDMPLDEARAMYPEWEFREVLGGYLAVPKGTPVVLGMFVRSVADKLANLDDPS